MKERIYKCDYQKLEHAALTNRQQDDLIRLYRWFELYGASYWNGDSYNVCEGIRIKGKFEPVDARREDFKLVGAELEF